MEQKMNDKLPHVKVLNRVMRQEDVSTLDIARLIKRSQRHVQNCLDLTRDTEFTTREMMIISDYFCSLNIYDLVGLFCGAGVKIVPVMHGQATGRIHEHLLKMNSLIAELDLAFRNKDSDRIADIEVKYQQVLSDVLAERAAILSKYDNYICRYIMEAENA